jgi:NAD(P)-dependent dehydrogenase (short-subunit alcohol dehydrogenase family)
MDIDLSVQNAIITGGGKGYGQGIAEALKKHGAHVWIIGRDEEALRSTSSKLGVHYMRVDVTKPEDWDRLIESVLQKEGKIDILVNNAGAGVHIAPIEEQSDSEILSSLSVNLGSVILGCKRVVPHMKRQRSGNIINISSVCARQAWPGWSVYSAAKAGLVQFSNCLYTELRDWCIKVTSVIPSWGNTGFLKAAHLKEFDSETRIKSIQPIELGELIATICALPAHLGIQDVTLWPLVQRVEPL